MSKQWTAYARLLRERRRMLDAEEALDRAFPSWRRNLGRRAARVESGLMRELALDLRDLRRIVRSYLRNFRR